MMVFFQTRLKKILIWKNFSGTWGSDFNWLSKHKKNVRSSQPCISMNFVLNSAKINSSMWVSLSYMYIEQERKRELDHDWRRSLLNTLVILTVDTIEYSGHYCNLLTHYFLYKFRKCLEIFEAFIYYGGPEVQLCSIYHNYFRKLPLLSTNHNFFLQYDDFFLQIPTFFYNIATFLYKSQLFSTFLQRFVQYWNLFLQSCNLFLYLTTFFYKSLLFSANHSFFYTILNLFYTLLELFSTNYDLFSQEPQLSSTLLETFFHKSQLFSAISQLFFHRRNKRVCSLDKWEKHYIIH